MDRNRGSRRERRDPYFDLVFVKAASVGGLFHICIRPLDWLRCEFAEVIRRPSHRLSWDLAPAAPSPGSAAASATPAATAPAAPDFMRVLDPQRRSNCLLVLTGLSRRQRRMGSSQTYRARRGFDAGAASVDIAHIVKNAAIAAIAKHCGKDGWHCTVGIHH
jgi:hypothetical protein